MSSFWAGVFWSVASGVGFGLFQVAHRKAGLRVDTYRATFVLVAVGAVLLGVLAALTEDLGLILRGGAAPLVYFSLGGLIHFVGGWTLMGLSQRRIGAARTSALLSTTPLFATILAMLTLNERLTPLGLLGVSMVVVGVYIVSNGANG